MTFKKVFIAFLILTVICLLNIIFSCSKPTKPKSPPVEKIHFSSGNATWSSDGRYIAYQYGSQNADELVKYGNISIWVYDSQTNKFGYLVGPGSFPRWSLDGSIVAFEWGNEIYFYYMATATVRQITNLGRDIYIFRWTPDGGHLSTTYDSLLVIDTTGRITKTIRPTNGIITGRANGSEANWSDSGDSILTTGNFTDSSWEVMLIDSLGNLTQTILTRPLGHEVISYVAWSPFRDKFIADYVNDAIDSNVIQDIRIYRMDGSVERILGDGLSGDWFPDGSKIVFQKYTFMGHNPSPMDIDYGRVTIWICNADGSDMHELLGWPQRGYDSTMFGGGYNWATDTHDP